MENYNILLVHNFYKVSGGEDTVFKNEKKMLIDNGNVVYEYTRDNNEINSMKLMHKILLPFINIFSLKTYREVKKIIKSKNIDIVHIHNYNNLISPSIFYVCKKFNVPVVQTVHNFRMLCPNGLFFRTNAICEDCPRKGLQCAIKYKCYHNSKIQTFFVSLSLLIHRFTKIYKYVNFIFLTDFNKNKFVEYNKKLKCFDETKFYIKPHFIEKQALLNMKSFKKKNQFIYVGRLSDEKGIMELVKLWKLVNNEKLIICGNGPLEEILKNYIRINQLNIELLGFVDHKSVLSKIRESKALIFPSKVYETFGLTIIESFCVGTPVISYNIGNSAVINTNGYLYNNEKELITYINNFNYNDTISVAKEYYKDENYKLLVDIYEKAIFCSKGGLKK